jgi:hypothetical protein
MIRIVVHFPKQNETVARSQTKISTPKTRDGTRSRVVDSACQDMLLFDR